MYIYAWWLSLSIHSHKLPLAMKLSHANQYLLIKKPCHTRVAEISAQIEWDNTIERILRLSIVSAVACCALCCCCYCYCCCKTAALCHVSMWQCWSPWTSGTACSLCMFSKTLHRKGASAYYTCQDIADIRMQAGSSLLQQHLRCMIIIMLHIRILP
jgi:hypothetical protein